MEKSSTVTTDETTKTTPLPDVIKGKSDWRNYRPLKLPNGATVVLVNDKESKTTAMSVCVNVGASSDPRELSGLAHFTEHMCFLGSEKYPGENEYKRYLSSHGGKSNASTSMSYTTYKFDVLAEHTEKAVDIFSNFFVSPLFTPSGTSREVNAVDSENSKNLTTDGRRRLQILKALADPNHHYSKFSTGNAITLPAASPSDDNINSVSDDKADEKDSPTETKKSANFVREALLSFHTRHYRPENMVIVIVGPQSLDTLQEWVVPRFAPIVDRWSKKDINSLTEVEKLVNDAAKDAPETRYDQPAPPFNPAFDPKIQGGTWPVLLTTLPLRSMRKLVLMFPLPSVRKVPDQSPVSILSHLLGHEGPGSSFAVLQDAGLLSSLSTGSRISAPDQTLLQIDVNLTEDGEEKWTEVVHTLFKHCRLIHQTALTARDGKDANERNAALEDLRRIWGEEASLDSMNFHQTSPSQAYSFAPSLAQRIVAYGTKQCLSAGSLLEENPNTLPLDDLIEFSSRLVPSNCIVERCSKGAWEQQMANIKESGGDKGSPSPSPFGLKKEKWYDIEYHLSKVDPDIVRTWESNDSVEEPSDNVEKGLSSIIEPLHLPTPNRYIPRTLELCPDLPEEARLGPRIEKEIDPPKLVVNQPGSGRLWHRLDDRYALPKSSLTILIRTAMAENVKNDAEGTWSYNVDAAMNSHILTGIFSDANDQETYDANLAGLYWSLYKTSSGITLSCSGYSDRLPDLATKLLEDFFMLGEDGNVPFLRESHFVSTKDRVIRGYKSYFQSRRADTQAMYFRDLLMSSLGGGIERSLVAAEAVTLESLKEQHRRILVDADKELECLFSGNVSEKDAKSFFIRAAGIVERATTREASEKGVTFDRKITTRPWIPGPFERRLNPGEDLELHFASKNSEEENGAVLVTYQSHVPGYKGDSLSSQESLKYTAAIRLICHMLREPLFDELRTKQQLGYVVSSYYDVNYSSRGQDVACLSDEEFHAGFFPSTTPIDSIVINILSRKASPPEVALRIDEFLVTFRKWLATGPLSEINDHAESLSKQLLKPIRKLGSEADIHFAKIRRYGPEVLNGDGNDKNLPWDSVKTLAKAIESLERTDLLEVWDKTVTSKTRSKIVSCVYGSTFPLEQVNGDKLDGRGVSRGVRAKGISIGSLDALFAKRKQLTPYGPKNPVRKYTSLSGIYDSLVSNKRALGVTAVAMVGMGIIGLSLWRDGSDRKSCKK